MTIDEFGRDEFLKLREAIAAALDVSGDEIVPEARFEEDLAADSFDMAMVLTEVDERFDTKIPAEETEYIRTVEDLMEIIPRYPAGAAEEKPVRWRSGF